MAQALPQSSSQGGVAGAPRNLSDYPQLVKMPDGVVVEFPGDFPPERIRALIAQKFPSEVSAFTAGPPGGTSAAASVPSGAQPPRMIQFEGRTIQVPADFTDDEVRAVLNSRSTAPPKTDDPWAAFPDYDPAKDGPLPGAPKPDPWAAFPEVAPPQGSDPWAAFPDYDPAKDGPIGNSNPSANNNLGSTAAEPAPFRQRVGWQGTGRGVLDIAALPLDLAQGALRAGSKGVNVASKTLGGPELNLYKPAHAPSTVLSEAFGKAANVLGFDTVDPEEMSPSERLVYNVNRFAAGAGVGGGGLALAAPRVGSLAPAARNIIGDLAKPYAKSARPLVGDVAGGVGAGTANSAYDQAAPDWLKDSSLNPIARILFDLLGGVAGATAASVAEGAGRGVVNAGKRAVGADKVRVLPLNELTREPFTVAEADKAARLAQAQADNPATAATNISDAFRELRPYGPPGSLPTVGALSDDVGLLAAENAARGANPVPFTSRQQRTNTQARELVDNAAPAGSEGRHFTDEANALQRGREASASANVETARSAQTNANQERSAAASGIRGYEGSQAARAQDIDRLVVDNTLLPMQERSSRLYAAVDPERAALIDATPLLEQAKIVRRSLGDLNDPSKVIPESLLRRIDGAGEGSQAESLLRDTGAVKPIGLQTSIGDLVSVQPEISATIARAERAGNYTLANNLRSLRQSMNQIIEAQSVTGNDAAKRAIEANANYRSTIGEAFGRGPGDEGKKFRKDFNLDRFNRTTTPPSATAGRFLQPGQPEKAESLRRILEQSDVPAAERERAVREYLLSDLAGSGVIDPQANALRPDALRRWRERWGSALDVVPGFRRELDDMFARAQHGERMSDRLSRDVVTAEAKLTDVQKNRGALELVLGSSPEIAVKRVLGSRDPERAMQEITNQLRGNPRATNGLKAAVRDYLTAKKTASPMEATTTGADPASFKELDKLFKQHERVLKEVYSPEEMRALRMAHKFLAPSKSRAPQSPIGAGSTNSDRFWKPLELALKAHYGILKGGGVLRTLKIGASTLRSDREAVDQLINQMWFDPELAQHLLTRNVKEIGTPYWNARLNRLLAYAAGVRGDDASGE